MKKYKITLLKTGKVFYASSLEDARSIAFEFEHLLPSIRMIWKLKFNVVQDVIKTDLINRQLPLFGGIQKSDICVINVLINILRKNDV